MAIHPVTIDIPEHVYRRLQRAAKHARRPIEQMLAETVVAITPVLDQPAVPERMTRAELDKLNDAVLWRIARTTLNAEQRSRLQWLHDKQQSDGLGAEQAAEEQALVAVYRETQLLRAQAIALLKQRNYDVIDPTQFLPLD